ncbi:hypothetical protein [Massilia endophytica]|uniref:hypothetical protein n=1 Tax=Massilia endophytica TaxID=2899220 RepID=UPI001E500CB6|nr:hypothetical protein [Massilia endophytica]UGQ44961.1 hypothetical protein LSQ66_14260 [Massilia endophytica]
MKQDMSRIKELLNEWAGFYMDFVGTGYPKQSAFATERVQTSNRSTETLRSIPDDVLRLNREIELMAPAFKQIIHLEYMDKRPAKTKAAVIKIPRQVYHLRLNWCYEHLDYRMWHTAEEKYLLQRMKVS